MLMLCSVIVARPRHFACPFRHKHTPHHRPTLLSAFNPPTVRNQFTTRQAAGTSTVFVLQSNLIGVKEEAKVLRTHTRTNA